MLRLVTPSTVQVVDLAMAKRHLRVDHDEDDTLIELYIAAAEEQLAYLGRALTRSTWAVDVAACSTIYLPVPPLVSLTSIVFDDAAGVAQTVDAGDYDVTVANDGRGCVRFASGYSNGWANGVATVVFEAGYETPPKAIQAAVLLILGDLYQTREQSTEKQQYVLPRGVDALVAPYRVFDWPVPTVWRSYTPGVTPEPSTDPAFLLPDGSALLLPDGVSKLLLAS